MGSLLNNYSELLERDPVVDSWPFMQSPIPVLTILVTYLYFVLKLGPKLMENKQPFTLKWLLIVYNAYQVLFCTWLCGQIIFSKYGIRMFYQSCKSATVARDLHFEIVQAAWWYFFSKIVDLLDTVFFVLRKKQSQVTFLHVYHHTSTMFFSWAYLKYIPGPQGALIGFLNSFVHIVMYSYYLIAALGPQYQKYLWWKKYMTWIQLTQFCLMIIYLISVTVMGCKLPKALTFFFVSKAVLFLYLFSDFYRKTYKKPKIDSTTQVEENKNK